VGRLDTELVRRGLARSRRQATDMIADGRVRVPGRTRLKPATPVTSKDDIQVSPGDDFASRGAYKLLGALTEFDLDVTGMICLDAGSSTGGFTDVLLRKGAQHVYGIDVGHDQLDPRLRADPRVTQRDGVNIRDLEPSDLPPVDLVVADLSFISLTYVLARLASVLKPSGEMVVLVKPQFEVGRTNLGSGGIVRDPELHCAALTGVADAAIKMGLGVHGVCQSQLPGPRGNLEFFLQLAHRPGLKAAELADQIATVISIKPDDVPRDPDDRR
jgi:23S rRNA (cytidine1920-2'-O)/16S rRNA (cytidine1409-2'-O)-methyltransferase